MPANPPDREKTFGPDRCDFMWCLHCERAYGRRKFRPVGDLQMCPYPDCSGDTVIDAWPWDEVRKGNPGYPVVPKAGKRYALYRNEKNIPSEFERFQHISKHEGGLIAKTHAALVLGVSKQRLGDLVGEKRLRQHDFFGKEFISCKDLAAFQKIERKTGRPKSSTESVDESMPKTQHASHEGKLRPKHAGKTFR